MISPTDLPPSLPKRSAVCGERAQQGYMRHRSRKHRRSMVPKPTAFRGLMRLWVVVSNSLLLRCGRVLWRSTYHVKFFEKTCRTGAGRLAQCLSHPKCGPLVQRKAAIHRQILLSFSRDHDAESEDVLKSMKRRHHNGRMHTCGTEAGASDTKITNVLKSGR